MSAMIYDTTEQAFVEAETPMKFDQENQSWADTTGLAYNPEAGAWEEKWSASKAFKGYIVKNGILQIPNTHNAVAYSETVNGGWEGIDYKLFNESNYLVFRINSSYCRGNYLIFHKPFLLSKGSVLHAILKRPYGNRAGYVCFLTKLATKQSEISPLKNNNGESFIVRTPYNVHVTNDTEYVSNQLDADCEECYFTLENAVQEISGSFDFYIKDVWIE